MESETLSLFLYLIHNLINHQMQMPRGDLGSAQSFVPPVLRVRPASHSPVETGARNSCTTLNSEIVDDNSTDVVDPEAVVMQESPRLYQDYGREPRA